ncbi:DUF6147 family protein [Paenibacillus sp. sptzw28]|uniref:DUF6147 family protein n=1 Tax=Paenibacillus sp. sptzw28 TaxID=715179 RepID=UPI002161534C|nr:DUF6147 family protein [Paenibacillus sp. sptzw28]
MQLIKKVGHLFLVISLMGTVLFSGVSLAASENQLPPAPTEGTSANNPTYGTSSPMDASSIESTQYLMSGESFISFVSGTRVTVSGNTKAYFPVDSIAVDLYLQRWDASKGQWVDVLYVGEFKNNNSSVVSGSMDVNVVSGYYYRTHSYHWVSEGGTVEQNHSYSSYIYVN